MRQGLRGMLPEKADPELLEWIARRAEAQDPRMALALFRDFPRLRATGQNHWLRV